MKKLSDLDQTKRLMGALVRMKPKPHEEMKVGKKKPAKASAKKRASSTIPHAVLPARLLGDRTYFQPDPIRIIGISSLPDTLMFSCCVVASSSVDGENSAPFPSAFIVWNAAPHLIARLSLALPDAWHVPRQKLMPVEHRERLLLTA